LSAGCEVLLTEDLQDGWRYDGLVALLGGPDVPGIGWAFGIERVLDADGARAFIARPGAEDAIRLRRWDEAAKVRGRETPPLTHFRSHAERCLKPGAAA
jgi:hypothetical protein